MKQIYILSAQQISAQNPLSETWMDNPLNHVDPFVPAIEPNYKQYFPSNQVRRMSKILKRALLTSRRALETAEIACPDAIIVGTGLGCIESTELFLDSLVREGEQLLKPTHFMQSTHNTISSVVAIDTHCHGYNTTYAHKGISFECALTDAFMQLRNGQAATALVGAHDEMTVDYFTLLKRAGYLGHAVNGFAGEAAVSLTLGTEPSKTALCRIEGIEMLYHPVIKKDDCLPLQRILENSPFRVEDADAVMIGVNGQPANDKVYNEICPVLFPKARLLRYKHLFGESYSASGLGVYAAAICLMQRRIPSHLFVDAGYSELRNVRRIVFYNQFEGKNHSFIFLSLCGE